MRVITGTAKGRKLKEPEDMERRPTSDLVKESLFNIIQFDLEGRHVLDLFAGTGQLGIEALSRGAASAVFVDDSQKAIALIKENLERTKLSDLAQILRSDWKDALRRQRKPFDIIFIDPPYEGELLKNSLKAVAEIDILSHNGIIVCESRADKILPELDFPYEKINEYRYGKIKLTLFTKRGNPQV